MKSHGDGAKIHEDLSIINEHRKTLAGPELLHNLVSAPSEKIAIDHIESDGRRQQISYSELNSYATTLQNLLQAYLIDSDPTQQVIPVIIPQCPELYISYIAILRCGAAFCPISLDVPPERLTFLMKDLGANVILTLPEHVTQMRRQLPDVKCLSVSIRTLKLKRPRERVISSTVVSQHPDSTAYIMYTSGSTGLPKGVRISHRSVTQSLLAHEEHLPTFKRFLQFASPTFDVSVFEIFFPFFRGATLITSDREQMLADLPGVLQKMNVDAAELTPTVVSTMLKTRDSVPSLKMLLTIGEMLTRKVLQEFGGSCTQDSMLYAMYGPTEASIHCSVASQISADSSVHNIGIPLSTVSAFILPEKSENTSSILPRGQIGELAISGQLASGYLNRPEQTQASFITLADYGPVYRTGDRAMVSNSGDLHILGRLSTGQVKLRGQRIELGEIEDVACRTQGVEVAAAIVMDESLILFCTGQDHLQSCHVQEVCKSWLPPFMRPNHVIILKNSIPRLPSGKLDRKALSKQYRQRELPALSGQGHYANETERNIAKMLEDELGVFVAPSEQLWSYGLTSLHAIRIAARLRMTWPQISVLMILEAETVCDLASRLKVDDKRCSVVNNVIPFEESDTWAEVQQLVCENLDGDAEHLEQVEHFQPCSPIQAAMLAETCAHGTVNFNTIILDYPRGLSLQRVEEAFEEVAKQNEILRSGFISTGHHEMPFVQIVWKSLNLRGELDLLHPFRLQINMEETAGSVTALVHHAIYDGWSWDLIIADVNKIILQQPLEIRPQYSEYVRHRRNDKVRGGEADLQYWKELMHEVQPTTMPNMISVQPCSMEWLSSQRIMTIEMYRFSVVATNLRVSRQVLVEAATILILSAYSASEDITLGVVISGREITMPDVDKVIGPCLSTFPRRINLAGVNTVRDLLDYLQRQHLSCIEYSHTALGELKQAVNTPVEEPMFDFLCVWQESLNTQTETSHPVKTSASHDALAYSMVLEAIPGGQTLQAKLTFTSTKMDNKQADLFLSQLDEILQQIASDPEALINEVTHRMSEELLSVANPKYESFDESFDLLSTVQRLAKLDPSRIAVEFVHDYNPDSGKSQIETVSYSELYRRASKVASTMIRQYHVCPSDLVCIMMEKSPSLYIAIASVMAAGAGYMCIDPATPIERVTQVLKEAKCHLVIVDGHHQYNLLQDLSIQDLSVGLMDRIEAQNSISKFNFPRKVGKNSLAYIVFTSGSTGIPKGVLITRKNILSNIHALAELYPYQPSIDKLLQACSQAFDVSVFEIFWTWHCGMTLCSARNDILFRDLESFICKLKITHLSMTPSVAALIAPQNVPTVKLLVTAGEPMNSKVYNMWADHGLYQGYGPSETTNICNVRQKASKINPMNNVGKAFPNTSIFICQRRTSRNVTRTKVPPLTLNDFELLPKGAIGEIWIGGDQVGLGYLDLELTARSWMEHPIHGTLYRSGDIGRLLADQTLVVLGREDDQVKLRGQRIELGEINAVLVQSHNVLDAQTLVVYEGSSAARLVSFWVATKANTVNEVQSITKTLFEKIQNWLPKYMVPNFVLPIEKIPLTKQGKTDKRSLLDYFEAFRPDELEVFSNQTASDEREEVLSDQEIQVAQILSNATGAKVDTISRNTSFFNYGLDSISSIGFSQALRKADLGLVDVSTILRNATLAKLLPILQNHSKFSNTNGHYSRQPISFFNRSLVRSMKETCDSLGYTVEKICPCTPLQEAMLSLCDDSTSSYYVNHRVFKVIIDPAILRLAWSAMVRRHEILRTGFFATEMSKFAFAQVVLKEFQLPWNSGDVSDIGFDGNGPLQLPPYKLTFNSNTPSNGILHLHIHHALYDAEAISVLQKEVEIVCKGSSLPNPVPFSIYLDYMLDFENGDVQTFWEDCLSNVRPCRIRSVLGLEQTSCPTTTVDLICSVNLHEVENQAREYSVTLQSLLQASLARLLCCYADTNAVCFGTVYSGRNLSIDHIENLVGPCFNTLPIHVSVKRSDSNRETCRRLQKLNTSILPYQPTSLRHLQRKFSPDGQPLFDILLLLQAEEPSLDSAIWTLDADEGVMDFPCIIEVIPSRKDDALLLRVHHKFMIDGIASMMLRHLDSLLRHTIMYPHASASNHGVIGTDISTLRQSIDARKRSIMEKKSQVRIDSSTWSSTELTVLEILKEIAGVEQQKLHKSTTIFQLGLDSISAIQVASQLRKRGFHITGGDILEGPSLGEIAATCRHKQPKQGQRVTFDLTAFETTHKSNIISQLPIVEHEIEAIWPSSITQSGILSQFIRSKGSLYCNSVKMDLKPHTDISKLKAAWDHIIERHQMLRTGFTQVDDLKHPFAMIVYKHAASNLPWYDTENGSGCVNQADVGSNIIQNLHRPGWQINVTKRDKRCQLQLFMLHALYDAQSLQMILNDVCDIYNAVEISDITPVSGLLSSILSSSSGSMSSQSFWREACKDLQPTKFPDLRIRHVEESQMHTTSLSSHVTHQQAQQRCASLGVGLQSVCQAAWASLLSAYTGQQYVTFGVTLSGRTHLEPPLEQAVFPCINTVPVCVDSSTDLPMLLCNLTKTNSRLHKYQNTALTSIKRWLEVEGDLFDTILVLQNFENNVCDAPWEIVGDDATAEYAVSLEVISGPGSHLILKLSCQSNLVPRKQANIILSQFDNLLHHILTHQDGRNHSQPKDLLSILPPVCDTIPTVAESLHELAERTAQETPHRVALEFAKSIEGEIVIKSQWTYEELNAQGNLIANFLLILEVKPGDMVAVCFDKCAEASFAILGVLKAGCAYVALDPSAPEARRDFILDDAKCSILLTTQDKVVDFEGNRNVKTIAVDDRSSFLAISDHTPKLARPVRSEDTCYCLYTSGTTGTPKGCLISHKSAVQAMLSFTRIFQNTWTEESRWLQFASFHFDVSVLEQYWSWSVGICVTSAPRDLLFEDLPGTIRKLGITHLDLTPSLARLLTPKEVPKLCNGVFIVGGEQVRQDVLDSWGGVGCLYNFYGPSEVTIGCTVHPKVAKGVKPTNIGQQWDNVGSFVLEPISEVPVLKGAIGELCLSGPLVGIGYLNRPELTANKFVVLKDCGVRVYRTGDLVRVLHDNSFEFLGRIDDQVKLRGQRLEIGEINHVIINSTEEITDVATLVLKHTQHDKEQLISFFSLSEGKSCRKKPVIIRNDAAARAAKVAKEYASRRLAAYMVPTYFIALDFMPLSANNKVEHKILKELYEQSQNEDTHTVKVDKNEGDMITTPRFNDIVGVLASFFGVDVSQIRPSSRLFELGMDSISVLGLSRVLKRTGFELADISVIMQNSRIEKLAHAIDSPDLTSSIDDTTDKQNAEVRIRNFSKKHIASVATSLGIEPEDIENLTPCTPLQDGMISKIMNSSPGEHVYFTNFGYEIESNVSLNKLSSDWRRVCERLGILRTVFMPTEDGFAQVVLHSTSTSGQQMIADGATVEADVKAKSFDQWHNQARNLGKYAPWLLQLFQKDNRNYMSLYIFHGIYDGNSIPLLIDALGNEYRGIESHAYTAPQFHQVLSDGPLKSRSDAETFWQRKMRSVGLLNSELRGTSEAIAAGVISERSSFRSSSLVSICNDLDVTMPAVFHAVLLEVLSEQFETNPTVGIVVSGRAIAVENIQNVIGPMFNTIPCTIDTLGSKPSLKDLIRACHGFNTDALPYQHTPLRDIAKWLAGMHKDGLFDCLYVFQKSDLQPARQHSLFTALPSESQPDYPLNVEVEQQAIDLFQISIVGKEDLISLAIVKKLMVKIEELLKQLEGGANPNVSELFHRPDLKIIEDSRKKGIAHSVSEVESEEWSIEAKEVRSQLALLSGVQESSLGLHGPTFFEIGLDSIDALKFSARLNKIGFIVPVSKMMKYPTIGGITAQLQEQAGSVEVEKLPDTILSCQSFYRSLMERQGLNTANVQMILPVSSMQEGLLLNYEQYYHTMLYEIERDVDVKKLQLAISKTISDLSILRTTFLAVEDIDGKPGFLQAVHRFQSSPVVVKSVTDVSALQALEKELAADTQITGPQLKIVLASLCDGKKVLIIGLPHALYDAWSLRLLHGRIFDSYAGVGNKDQDLSQIIKHIESSEYGTLRNDTNGFWSKYLSQCTVSLIQPAYDDQNEKVACLIRSPLTVSVLKLNQFCRTHSVTMQSLGLACWSLVLAHRTGSLDVCFGLVLSGRTSEGSDELVFPTFNTTIFRALINRSMSRVQLLRKIHDSVIDASAYQHFPLRESLKLAGASQATLFDSLFTFQKAPGDERISRALYKEFSVTESPANPPYPVNVEMGEEYDQMWWTIAVQNNVFAKDELKSILRDLNALISGFFEEAYNPVITDLDGQVSIYNLLPLGPKRKHLDIETRSGTRDVAATGDGSWSQTEIAVRDILAILSKTPAEKLSKDMSIFNLGLDSISAIRLASNMKKQGFKISVSEIIRAQTVQKIAAKVINAPEKTQSFVVQPKIPPVQDYGKMFSAVNINPQDVESVLPTAPGQVYMLDTWQASSGRLFYAEFWFETSGTKPQGLQLAFDRLVDCIPQLRTTFVEHAGSICQVIFKPGRCPHQKMPWSLSILKDDKSCLAALRIHHALYDAVSLQLIIDAWQDFCERSECRIELKTDVVPFLSAIQTSDIDTITKSRHFWTQYLNSDIDRHASSGSFTSKRVEHFVPEVLNLGHLTKLVRKHGISIQFLFFAAYAKIHLSLAPSTQSTATGVVYLGVYLANRSLDIESLSELTAPIFNIVPIKIDTNRPLIDCARQIQSDLQEISRPEYCGVNLRLIYNWTGIQLNGYLNFLKLPMNDDKEEVPPTSSTAIQASIVHAQGEARERARQISMRNNNNRQSSSPFYGQESNSFGRAQDWCIPAIDIEAKIDDNDVLAMGVFAPSDMLKKEQVESVIEQMREMLQGIAETNEEGGEGDE